MLSRFDIIRIIYLHSACQLQLAGIFMLENANKQQLDCRFVNRRACVVIPGTTRAESTDRWRRGCPDR